MQGLGDYVTVFLPWYARPDRDMDWYTRQRAEMFEQQGTDDDFFAEYPETPEQALAPETLDRRLAYAWVEAGFVEATGAGWTQGRAAARAAPYRGLAATYRRRCPAWWFFAEPVAGRAYVVGVDPAEGNPRSDESAAQVLDAQTGEQMALLAGKVEPTTFAGYCIELAIPTTAQG